MLRKNAWILLFFLVITSLILIFVNYKYASKIKLLTNLASRSDGLLKLIDSINPSLVDPNKPAASLNKNDRFVEVEEHSRDFYRYKCKKRKRIGGYASYLARVPHELYRTEGWLLYRILDYFELTLNK